MVVPSDSGDWAPGPPPRPKRPAPLPKRPLRLEPEPRIEQELRLRYGPSGKLIAVVVMAIITLCVLVICLMPQSWRDWFAEDRHPAGEIRPYECFQVAEVSHDGIYLARVGCE